VVPPSPEAAKCYFSKPVAQSLILVGSTSIKHFFSTLPNDIMCGCGATFGNGHLIIQKS